MKTMLTLSIILLPFVLSSESCTLSTNLNVYLQSEMSATSVAQNKIISFLKQNNIPIGDSIESVSISRQKRKESHNGMDSANKNELAERVVVSTRENNIECRIALGRAPLGSKCVAPCGCSGSQKWIEFRQFNRLRRTDPSQWVQCQTCRQPFQIALFAETAGVPAQLLGLMLDRKELPRAALLACLCVAAWCGALLPALCRLVVSRPVWQQYPHWSKLTHLPLPLKLWLGKALLQQLAGGYLALERRLLWARLVEAETALLDRALPAT
mmetsp:Transcript_25100/g.36040  ORF Transcript_25100/g.36040 Transcript_25100/m.36040 type:complete len:269 (+) Transcript_25100:1894-2700(+)